MLCPRCKIELRCEEKEGAAALICRNPRCEQYDRIVVKLEDEQTEEAENDGD
ncbi:MAG: hypothetical protein IJB67_05250 [Firmicutes bacterium]|nr:hypothetical protein [Bacillota bacterium]